MRGQAPRHGAGAAAAAVVVEEVVDPAGLAVRAADVAARQRSPATRPAGPGSVSAGKAARASSRLTATARPTVGSGTQQVNRKITLER